MFNALIQLYIEHRLSGAKPYLASHPELGIPLGVFNYKDEPNRAARINSIKKYGKKGNPHSYKLAEEHGIKNPLPSYQIVSNGDPVSQQDFDDLKKKVADLENQLSSGSRNYSGAGGIGSATSLFTNLEKEVRQANLTMDETIGILQTMATGGPNQRILAFRELNALADGFRKTLTKNIGMTEGMMDQTTDVILYASGQLDGFALTANDVLETLEDTMSTVGRQLSIPPSVLADMSKIDSLFGEVSADFVANFDKIGSGAFAATQAIQDTVLVAQNMGLTVSKLLPDVAKNISKINTYGFKNGVQGLTSMVAQSQRLGLSMEGVLAVSDKAFSPEGAIEMAAQLQMIGGATAELLDPFQLMYMAQNDVEALGESIVEMTESAVNFDAATGEFGLTPSDRMRLKKQAEALGLDYEELAETAIRNAKRTQALAQFDIGGNIDERTAELISGMAEVGPGGKMSISIADESGEAQTYLLEDLNQLMRENPELLKNIEEQANKDAMSLDEVQKQQLTVSDAIKSHTASMNNILIKAAHDGAFGDTARDFADAIDDADIGADKIANTTVNMAKELSGPEGIINKDKLTQLLETGIGDVADTPYQIPVNDFIITPEGGTFNHAGPGQLKDIIQPAKNDTIMGGTDIFNSFYDKTESILPTGGGGGATGAGGTGEVRLTGTLELKMDGKSMNINADDIFRALTPPQYEKLALNLSNTVYGSQT
jgi:hypothetical protein